MYSNWPSFIRKAIPMNPPALRQKRLPRGLSRQFHLDFAMRIAAKVGIKILQPSIVKYTIPLVSIGIGTGWTTRP
jgi:hypothetical protein